MASEPIVISAVDCMSFKNVEGNEAAFKYFIEKSEQFERFHFSETKTDDGQTELAYYNPKMGWVAGRMVGEAQFNYEEIDYKIVVKPRFGEVQLFRMLSEVFNIRFTTTENRYKSGSEENFLIRKLLSYLWLDLLAKGNRYGLPRKSERKEYYGEKIRGNLRVRDSLVTMKTEGKLHSIYNQRSLDHTIARLLKQCYEILKARYFIKEINHPQNALFAIQKLNAIQSPKYRISEKDYRKIKFKEIYKTYKPVIDLSWDIIKNENIHNKMDGNFSSINYFIDMAELWELYIKSLLKKEFSKSGWQLMENEFQSYEKLWFKRKLIPDVVLKKGSQVIVLDAKYKLMREVYNDLDRSDFFQIHTYIHYLQHRYDVLFGGLIYPFSTPIDDELEINSRSDTLYSQGLSTTRFCIDGIDLSFLDDDSTAEGMDSHFKESEFSFVNRIKQQLTNQPFKQIA